ncbi:hypothetical protein [Floridanema evergladense]|uniref:Uncharacterized protein n=1 Tax=Floridaenema evergladense BLCC-F167 TaxID=3153639 RepID=A0ABV4WV39_9CYAN
MTPSLVGRLLTMPTMAKTSLMVVLTMTGYMAVSRIPRWAVREMTP